MLLAFPGAVPNFLAASAAQETGFGGIVPSTGGQATGTALLLVRREQCVGRRSILQNHLTGSQLSLGKGPAIASALQSPGFHSIWNFTATKVDVILDLWVRHSRAFRRYNRPLWFQGESLIGALRDKPNRFLAIPDSDNGG